MSRLNNHDKPPSGDGSVSAIGDVYNEVPLIFFRLKGMGGGSENQLQELAQRSCFNLSIFYSNDESIQVVMHSNGFEYLKENWRSLQWELLKIITGGDEECNSDGKSRSVWAQLSDVDDSSGRRVRPWL